MNLKKVDYRGYIMEYFRIKKGTFKEIAIFSLFGILIALICVLYLVNQIVLLKGTIYEMEQNNIRKSEDYNALIKKIIDAANVTYEKNEILESKEEEKKQVVVNSTAQQNTSYYNAEESDRDLLAKILYCDGGGESVDCQKAIMSVIVNRLNSGKWGNTIKSVIYAKGQFSPIFDGSMQRAKPTQTQYDIVDYVLENGSTLPSWVMYFRASYHFSWKGYTPYCTIDNTYFGGMGGE